ncbi:MAG: hypothetical protein K6U80_18940 [Firmicutes bacterium]|nr:hypothetical protein [Bacillota bacterium]
MKMKLGRISILFLFVLALVVVGGCFLLPQRAGYVKILVYSGEPNSPAAVVNAMETLFTGIDGLKPFERYEIKILNSNGALMAEYALSATQDGKIPPTAMWPEAGLPPVVDSGPADPKADIQVGSYKIVLTGPDTNVTFPFSVISRNTPAAWASDSEGKICGSFQQTTDKVYVTGMNFPAIQPVTVYIMPDKNDWSIGDLLDDPNTYFKKITGPESVTDSGGKLHVDLGAADIDPAHGHCANFDIIVDANQDGYLDNKDAIDGRNDAGYTVQRTDPSYRKFQIASNGKSLDYTSHWYDQFYYPDEFNADGSGTGFPWAGFGRGVFGILNPLIDDTSGNGLVYWSQVQIWVLAWEDFDAIRNTGGSLIGKDVSDAQGRPDRVWVQRTCSNGAGSILIWPAPLTDRRPGYTHLNGQKYVVIVEKPDQTTLQFTDTFDPNRDYVDGVLIGADPLTAPITEGFRVIGL